MSNEEGPGKRPEEQQNHHHLRFGLCCLFRREPVRFRTTTALALSRLTREQQLKHLSAICRDNAESLCTAIETCARLGIRAFRIVSSLLPRMTHPLVGYRLEELPQQEEIRAFFARANDLRRRFDVRLSLHPDQFVVLSSLSEEVVHRSVKELEYHAEIAELVGAEVINIHAGGAQGGRAAALARLAAGLPLLSDRLRSRLTLENDDVTYTVRDLLPICTDLRIPLVYDVHHHRCLPDGFSVEEATELAAATWEGRESWLHISSPKYGWGGMPCRPHADFIDPADFPSCWLGRAATVDVEAKAKELAVERLMADVGSMVAQE